MIMLLSAVLRLCGGVCGADAEHNDDHVRLPSCREQGGELTVLAELTGALLS